MLEPEALGRVRVLGLLAELRLLLVVLVDPVLGLLVRFGLLLGLGLLLVLLQLVLVLELLVLLLVGRRALDRPEVLVVVLVQVVLLQLVLVLVLLLGRRLLAAPARAVGARRLVGPRMSAEASSSGEAEESAPSPSAERWASASSAVSVPESASTWCAESTVPSTSFGSSSDSRRSRPSSSENSLRQAVDGFLALGSAAISASAMSSARRRGVPGASATAGSSPSCKKRSRTSFSAREISAELGMVAASRAAEVDSAIQALDFETRAAAEKLSSARLGRWHPLGAFAAR